jgi:histidinol-phosphate aminotransferase
MHRQNFHITSGSARSCQEASGGYAHCQPRDGINDEQSDMALTRPDYLTTSGLALSALALSTMQDSAHAAPPPRHARLNLNENPFGPSQRALAAIREQSGELCRYVDDEADVLTPAIVAREGVSADQIVLGEILEALGRHLAADGPAGGEFIYTEPGYAALVNAVKPAGGIVVGVPLDERLQNDLAAIAAKLTPQTRAIYLVNPHNPTGTVNDAVAFTSFVRDMSKRTTVIVDEAHLEFEPDFEQRTVAGLTRAGENVIVFRTFGKIYGLAGLAVGYAITPKPLAASLKRAGIGVAATLTRPALTAAAASLQDQDYVVATRAKVTAEREKWHQLFAKLKLRHTDARGNFVFFETAGPTMRSQPLFSRRASISVEGIRLSTGGLAFRSACPRKTPWRGPPSRSYWAERFVGLRDGSADGLIIDRRL